MTLPNDILDWIEKQIEERRFASVNHAIEFAVYQLMKREKGDRWFDGSTN